MYVLRNIYCIIVAPAGPLIHIFNPVTKSHGGGTVGKVPFLLNMLYLNNHVSHMQWLPICLNAFEGLWYPIVSVYTIL
jgi:hypothetical protein